MVSTFALCPMAMLPVALASAGVAAVVAHLGSGNPKLGQAPFTMPVKVPVALSKPG